MANKIRIKRRAAGGSAGAPASLENAELAFNEQDDVLYYGEGTGGVDGTATQVIAIAGPGAFTTLGTAQTISGNKEFSGTIIVPAPSSNTHAATKLYVDNAVANATISNEVIEDAAAALFTNGTHSGIGVTYDDANAKVNLDVADFTLTLGGDLTGNVAITNLANATLTAAIASNTIVDADVATTAAIAYSKLSLSNSIVNSDISDAAAVALSKLASGTSGQVVVANTAGVPTYVTLTGDVTIAANGQTTIAADSVALGTDTTGNYVGSVAAGTGISLSNTGVEGGAFTVTLANTAVDAGGYGSNTTVPTFVVDAQGRLTSVTNQTIAITASQITDRATNLVTGLTGTANEIAVSNSGVGAVTLSLPANVTIANNLTVTGDLTVQGNTTTLNTATLVVEDKNIVLANVATPTDTTADGAGISVLGNTNKTFNWVDATDSWTSSEHIDLASTKVFKIAGVTVLSGTNLDNVTVDGGTF